MSGATGLTALQDVLAKNLNEITDLPDYVNPPAGVYKLLVQDVSQKEIAEKTALVVTYLVLEMKELNNAEADGEEVAAIKFGKDLMSEAFFFDDPEKLETTLGALKKKYGGLGATLGTTNLYEILEKMKGLTLEAQVTRRMDKNDKTRFYAGVKTCVAAV